MFLETAMRLPLITVVFALFGLVCAPAAADVANPPVPNGWHLVTLSEFKGTEDFHFRMEERSGGLQASGDFDGDGRVDFARVLESNDRRTCAVFLTYYPKGHVMHHELANFGLSCNSGIGESLYVVSESPSRKKIKTWCGKGAFCEKGDTDFIKLELPGVGFGLYEASYSIVSWDKKSRQWHTALISD